MSDYYKRAILVEFHRILLPNKVLFLLGARRLGKTALIKNYLETWVRLIILQKKSNKKSINKFG
jgi:predicted AAA+ superfamily ATPase